MSKIRIDKDDIIAKRFGKLVVFKYKGIRYDYTKAGIKIRHMYLCKCDCGNWKEVRRCHLITNKTHSCGCLLNNITGKKERNGN